MELIVDGNRGIYCPQTFVKAFEQQCRLTCKKGDVETVLKGPGEYYWESWQNIQDDFHTDNGTERLFIYENQDVWLATEKEISTQCL